MGALAAAVDKPRRAVVDGGARFDQFPLATASVAADALLEEGGVRWVRFDRDDARRRVPGEREEPEEPYVGTHVHDARPRYASQDVRRLGGGLVAALAEHLVKDPGVGPVVTQAGDRPGLAQSVVADTAVASKLADREPQSAP